MSKTYRYTHMVFGTKGRQKTINKAHKEDLLKYIFTLLQNKGNYVYRINAMEDHVHLFFDRNASMLESEIAQFVKGASSHWMKKSGLFPQFEGWAKEYFCGSISSWDKDRIINYVANQEHHHAGMTFVDEIKRLYASAGLRWDDRDFL